MRVTLRGRRSNLVKLNRHSLAGAVCGEVGASFFLAGAICGEILRMIAGAEMLYFTKCSW